MATEVEATDEFVTWWESLTEPEKKDVAHVIDLLAAKGVGLGWPFSSQIKGARHSHMRELRIQHQGRPYRVFYCFDPRRMAILLIGGVKAGQDRFYEEMVPKADAIYDAYLADVEREGLL